MSQTAFAKAVLDPALPVPTGLTDPLGRPAPLRFGIYRNNVTVGLVTALEQAFPVLRQLVGAAFFAAMAREHLRAHPPRGPVLMQYGADFPAFLEGFAPVAHLPYLPDVARLELLLRESYHAADAAPLPLADLTALPAAQWMRQRLHLAPMLRHLASRWPVGSIWLAHQAGGPPPQAGPQEIVILRPGFDPLPHPAPPGSGQVIAALQGGATLAAALDTAPSCDPGRLLTLLLTGGAITGVFE